MCALKRSIAATFAALLSFTYVELALAEGAAGKIKIALIAPLTGPVATWGKDVQNTLLFAREQRPDEEVEFVIEDDRCLGKEAQSAAQKVTRIDHVDYAIVVCSESLLTTAPIFERAGVTVITPSATADAVSRSGDFIFRTYPSDRAAALLLMQHIAPRHRRVGLISELRGYSHELAVSLKETADSSVTLVTTEFATSDYDVRAQLLKLKQTGIDGLIVNPNSEERFLQILRQTRELMGQMPVYGVHFPANNAFLQEAGNLADGIVVAAVPSKETSFSPVGANLLREFQQRYGRIRSSDFVFASTFEAFRLFVQGAAHAEPRADLRNFLYNGKFEGVFGSYSFDRNGDITGVGHRLYRIVAGHTVPI